MTGSERPQVHRVGRRRVVTHDRSGVIPETEISSSESLEGQESTGDRPRTARERARPQAADEPLLDARERWLLEQRPPHWG